MSITRTNLSKTIRRDSFNKGVSATIQEKVKENKDNEWRFLPKTNSHEVYSQKTYGTLVMSIEGNVVKDVMQYTSTSICLFKRH